MALKLDTIREVYKEFYGRNIEMMPIIISEGRIPMNVSQLIKRRLETRNLGEIIREGYIDNYFDTGDGVAYHPDGRIKVVLDSQLLRTLAFDTSTEKKGARTLTEEDYSALRGEEFDRKNLGRIGELLSREEVKAHPVWKTLARDQTLLNDYTDYIFSEVKRNLGYDAAMGLFLCHAEKHAFEMRAWCINKLEEGSCISGMDGLNYNNGRLVGIALEDFDGTKISRSYDFEDVKKFNEAVEKLKEVVNPNLLQDIIYLQYKL